MVYERKAIFNNQTLMPNSLIPPLCISLLFIAAYFGKGVYFAVNAWYSAQEKYAVVEKATGCRYMFVCKMLVGEYTKGSKEMKVAPALPDRPNELYDTLVDNVGTPTIFVAMTDSQAYAEYLIKFKLDKK